MFLKLPVIIIMGFGENNVLLEIFFDMYKFWEWRGGEGVHGTPDIFCLLFKKNEKVHDLYENQILHHFYLKNFFPRMDNKKIKKRIQKIKKRVARR